MKQVNLNEKEMEMVLSILRKYAAPFDVWAFGSRVAMANRETSDLDIVVINYAPLPIDQITALREAFSESDIPIVVDIVEWAGISDSFRKIIENNHVVLKTKTRQ